MNTRLFVVLSGAVSLLGLGLTACTTETTGTGGAGGTGGATTTTTTTTTTTSSANGGAGGEGGGTGGAGGAECISCGEALTDLESEICGDGDPPEAGSSAEKYYAYVDCACAQGGACADAAECGDSLCMGMAESTECTACLADMIDGCGAEQMTCVNDP